MALTVDIEKNFGAFRLKVCFSADNERLALLGASGCGKSVTLRCIAGILMPDRGRITLNGRTLFDSEKRVNLTPQERHTGFLFQQYALFPNMTVRQNIAAGLPETVRKRGGGKIRAEQRVSELMTRFRITDIADLRPGQISGGQKQRTALARILASEPELILLDEPFSALDSFLKEYLEPELQNMLAGFRGPVLWVSHDRGEVCRNCDRVCVIDRGCSGKTQTVKELFAAPRTEAAARLSGCGNFAAAVTPDQNGDLKENEVFLPQWGLTLTCGSPVPPDTAVIGIRSGHIVPAEEEALPEADPGLAPPSVSYGKTSSGPAAGSGESSAAGPGGSSDNTFPCRVVRVTEDVHSMIFLLRPEGAAEDAPLLRMETEKEIRHGSRGAAGPDSRLYVRIPPEHILQLRRQTGGYI